MKTGISLCLTLAALLLGTVAVSRSTDQSVEVLQAGDGLQWRRGNLHTHSHWSDGDDYLEMIALWYKERGYDFLVFSDHNVLATTEKWVEIEKTKGGRPAFEQLQQRFPDWVEQRTRDGKSEVRLRRFDEVAARLNAPEQFLLIQGEEISDSFEKLPVHLIAGNIQEVIPPRHGNSVYETIQNNVDAVLTQRTLTGQPMLVHLNHPNFHFAVTAEDLMRVQGEKFFEIYNGHPDVHNHGDHWHAGTERIWDIVLAQRLGVLHLPVMYGVAVDDGHNYHNLPNRQSNPGRGWVMVLTRALTPEALIEALEAGKFYASSGVFLSRLESSRQGLSLEVKADPGVNYTIEFIGTKRTADLRGSPVTDEQGKPVRATLRYSEAVGEVLKRVEGTSAHYRFSGEELYVRARVTSSRAHPNPSEVGDLEQAWTQPIVVNGSAAAQ